MLNITNYFRNANRNCNEISPHTGQDESESESHSVVSESLWPHGLCRPEYWSGKPFPSPGDLPNPGIKARSPALQVDSLPSEPQGKPKTSLPLLPIIFLAWDRLWLFDLHFPSNSETKWKRKKCTSFEHLLWARLKTLWRAVIPLRTWKFGNNNLIE